MKFAPALASLLVALLLSPLEALHAAELQLASVFSANTVLQRDQPVPVWGWAEANTHVTVEFSGQKKETTAEANGKWSVRLDALPANASPTALSVSAPSAKPVSVGGVVVGDVFLCAGGGEVGRRATDTDALPDDPKLPPVRVFTMASATAREPQADAKGRWMPATNATLKSLPAQAVHLGHTLAAENKVPVGIISVSASSPVETWISREALDATPEAAKVLAFFVSDVWKLRTVGTYEERLKAWTDYCQKLPLNPPPKPKPDDLDTLAKQEPAAVWNGSIAPLVPLALRGIVWDGGEDWASQNRAFQHGQLLPALIGDWRKSFGNPALPFVVVELRPHRYAVPFGIDGRLAAELRDAQRAAVAKAKAAIVTTIDFPADPPPREVAARIADVLQGHDNTGPVLASTETQGNKVVLHFTSSRGGLKARGGELKGFAIASSIYRWVWADATIEGDRIIVSAPTVPKPQGVRYAYEDVPSRGATLTDGEGHPAAPFRTDTHFAMSLHISIGHCVHQLFGGMVGYEPLGQTQRNSSRCLGLIGQEFERRNSLFFSLV